MIEIDVKIGTNIIDRFHVTNADKEHLGLTMYKVETFRNKTFHIAHDPKQGLFALLNAVFGHTALLEKAHHSGDTPTREEEL